MLKLVREGRIEFYCECLKDKGNDNINEVIESEDESESVEMEAEYSVVGGGYDKKDEDILLLEARSLNEREDYECSCQASSSSDEDNVVSNDSNRPVSQYNDINDDGVLTPSSIDEDKLFDKERKRKTMLDVYDPRVDYVTFKFKLMQRFNDIAECKGVVKKWAIIYGYNFAGLRGVANK